MYTPPEAARPYTPNSPLQLHAPLPMRDVPFARSKKPRRKTRSHTESPPGGADTPHYDWELWKDWLFHLYITENHTLEELSFEMSAMHGFSPSLSTYAKKFTSKDWEKFRKDASKTMGRLTHKTKPHGADMLSLCPQAILGELGLFLSLRTNGPSGARPTIEQEPGLRHEENGWSFTDTKFKGVVDDSAAWQFLSDQCSGFAISATTSVAPRSIFLFAEILTQLRTLAGSPKTLRGPYFLVCLYHFKATIGLGCWKTAHLLAKIVGEDHLEVLGLGAYCTKNWGRFSLDKSRLSSCYKSLMDNLEAKQNPMSIEPRIAVLYSVTHALSTSVDQTMAEEAAKSVKLTQKLCEDEAKMELYASR
ncbi:unnamed protein product [Parascedosporium putredinis]|uniref:Clr5 domain-containing protein n=1 Tax=Parascedosporium putredinis TaxID=1442378 RepID=A0A9P1H4W5_9PEZI|nr:unnamed protein product [Parascedosporium putredinis]CAI7997069.1 unnamed protein product [Parascedosporium putredinis]